MCDYSLHAVKSRDATKGERLVSAKFPNTDTRGFASVDDQSTAVCLLPGTELSFDKEIQVSRWVFFKRKFNCTTARFRKLNDDNPFKHHDALELADGKLVLLTDLLLGQVATVIVLPVRSVSSNDKAAPADEVKREQEKVRG